MTEFHSHQEQDKNAPNLTRSKKKKIREGSRHDAPTFLGTYQMHVFFGLSLILALFFSINPLPRFIPREVDDSIIRSDLPQTIAYGSGAVILGITFSLISILLLFLIIRGIMANNRRYWSIMCPNCEGNKLKRLERTRFQRTVGKVFFLPIRRYICSDCGWKGSRVDYTRLRT